MAHLTKICLALMGAAALAGCGGEKARETAPTPAYADTVFTGGAIYTGSQGATTVEAVAVTNGAVTGLGADADIEAAIGPDTEIIDLEGAAMFPGFVDAHAHLIGIGFRELTLNLEDVASVAELVDVVGAEAAKAAPGGVIDGRGWIETGWPEDRFPTRDDLDPVTGAIPAILTRADGHAVLVNSAALNAVGIDDATPDPDGGRIDRDAAGRATGILIDNAIGLVRPLIADPSPQRVRQAYVEGGRVYAAYGWTGLHNMSVDPADRTLMEALSDEGALGVRVYNALSDIDYDAFAASGPWRSQNGRVMTRALKLYVDGALGSRGAKLSAPYSDAPETDGLLLMSQDEARGHFEKAKAAGVQVATHAIGDRGNMLVLDWYKEALGADGAPLRWRIEHAQILHTEDIPRFATQGVIASMQPSHAIGDLHFAPDRLGDARLDGAYAWRSLIDAGAVIAAGSDAPVERGDPMIEFYAAVARRDLKGFQGENWRPGEAVTREEALAMFTRWPAYAAFEEESLGAIEIGKRADFSVFSADIMVIPEEDIPEVRAVMTVVDGEVIYRAEED